MGSSSTTERDECEITQDRHHTSRRQSGPRHSQRFDPSGHPNVPFVSLVRDLSRLSYHLIPHSLS